MDLAGLGKQIKAAREAAGMTQEELSAALDMTPNHISALERGAKLPRIDTFIDIANCLHVSADALLVGLVDEAKVNQVNALAARILSLPEKKQARVLRTIETLLDL